MFTEGFREPQERWKEQREPQNPLQDTFTAQAVWPSGHRTTARSVERRGVAAQGPKPGQSPAGRSPLWTGQYATIGHSKLLTCIDCVYWWFSSKEPACNAGDPGSIPRSGRSPREGNDHPLQCSCLGNPMDREAWRVTVHRVAERWPQWKWLSVWTCNLLSEHIS